jgi:hypothetical protein
MLLLNDLVHDEGNIEVLEQGALLSNSLACSSSSSQIPELSLL